MTQAKDPICFLHPGKTGGTYLKSVIRHNEASWTCPIMLMSHRASLKSTRREYGPNRKLAFTYRNPADRFVSAFQSRRRQGRPTYNRNWSPGEAISFLYFETATAMAEALDSPDERLKSAALFAFKSIMHIKKDYAFHFESLSALADEVPNIVGCLDLARFDTGLPKFLDCLGISKFDVPDDADVHANPEPPETLSEHGLKNLKTFWEVEFEFYDAFKDIEQSLMG